MMPIVLEVITKGAALRVLVTTITYPLVAILADGEMCALIWMFMIALWILSHHDGPRMMPPEQGKYIPKKQRFEKCSWIMSNIPISWKTSIGMAMVKMQGNAQRSEAPSRRSRKAHYQEYSPARSRWKNREQNRGLAMSLKLVTITCYATAVMAKYISFDSDSKQIANCSSRCLTNSRSNFLPGTVKRCNVAVLGVGGRVRCKIKGTIIEDDDGRAHDIVIPDTPLCSVLPHRLLSPQHWAQEVKRNSHIPLIGKARPSCSTKADETTLRWGQGSVTSAGLFVGDCGAPVAKKQWMSGSIDSTDAANTEYFMYPGLVIIIATLLLPPRRVR
jgi:hypothetical protein